MGKAKAGWDVTGSLELRERAPAMSCFFFPHFLVEFVTARNYASECCVSGVPHKGGWGVWNVRYRHSSSFKATTVE